MAARLFDMDGTFFRGMKSDSDPGQLPMGYYWNGINVVNSGGVISCRPGHRCVVQLPEGNLQGAALFRPGSGVEQLVCCISGILYAAEYPFKTFRQLSDVLLSPDAKQVFWAMTTQSARRTSSDLTSPIELIDPRALLIVQDGGLSAPAWFDGAQSGQIRGDAFGLLSGSQMRWVGDRLWVARGKFLYASDIGDPLSFRELIYLGGVGAFVLPDEITALAITPGLESPQLLAFTSESCTLFQANIRERASWPATPDFSKEIFSIGAVSQRSVVLHFGQLFWYSQAGICWFDVAVQTRQKARIAVRDNEMNVSKSVLHTDLSLVAGGAFGSFMLMSVPAEDTFNRHTWVLNDASLETLTDDSGASWCGYWLGTRPVEWVYGSIAGAERIYHVAADEDGVNRLWESFRPERLDNGCPITWAVETRGYFGQTSQAQKLPGSDCRFAYADIALTGIEEDLDLAAFYAGGLRGAYKKIMTKRVNVARGSVMSGVEITASTELFALKPQTRQLRSEDARGQDVSLETGSCPAETDKLEDYDESFQLLVVGQGPATIRWIRAFAQPRPEDQSGSGAACENETGSNAVRFDGAGASAGTDEEAAAAANLVPVDYYESNQTATITVGSVSSVGVGHATSIISQEAADRVASIIAVQQAELQITAALPPILSAGIGFNS